MGNWCLILLRNFGRQYRTYALKLSHPRSIPDQDGNIGGSWIYLLHGYTKYRATQGAIFSERITETNCVTPTHWVTEKLTSKLLDLHPWHSTIWSKGNHHLLSSPWGVKGLDHMSSITTFKALNSNEVGIHESHSIIANKADFKWMQEHLSWAIYPGSVQREQAKTSSPHFCLEGVWLHNFPAAAWGFSF